VYPSRRKQTADQAVSQEQAGASSPCPASMARPLDASAVVTPVPFAPARAAPQVGPGIARRDGAARRKN